MSLPETLSINAWTGDSTPSSAIGPGMRKWSSQQKMARRVKLLTSRPPEVSQWDHPKVGWGVVLSDNDALSEADRAAGVDAPEPIRTLLEARAGAPVLRYRPEDGFATLRRYYVDAEAQKVAISGGPRGIARGCMPRYLLIVGSPAVIPWQLQFRLNLSSFVGRLDLDDAGLKNYVDALISDWPDAQCQSTQPVVWSVDHGNPDITFLMRHTIGAKLYDRLKNDADIGDNARFFGAGNAVGSTLTTALADRSPALIVTTSHGMTGPSGQPELMAEQLGWLVDQDRVPLSPADVLQAWQPDGAIWYAHACCSAGSDAASRFAGLVSDGSTLKMTLEAVAGLGALTAPFPRALLSAKRPLRAFIGHVEPTFDYTLRSPKTGQVLTDSICTALYDRMHLPVPEPVGLAFDGFFDVISGLQADWRHAISDINAGKPDARERAVQALLTVFDRESAVILGDPTVAMPPLQS